jgi:capsular polysaccharide biosynthesis protein
VRPEEYLLIVLRRWWVVLLAAVIAAGGAYAFTSREPTTYQTSARLMAIAQPPDYWLDLYAKNRLASYMALIGNWDFVSGAIKSANLNVDPGLASSELTIGHDPDTNTIQLVVTDTDPKRAAAIVNALADAFVKQSQADNAQTLQNYPSSATTPRGTVEIVKLDTPSAPTTPIGPRVKLNTAAGGVLGFALGVLLAFGVEYLDDTLRGERDVVRALELPVVAGIPRSP